MLILKLAAATAASCSAMAAGVWSRVRANVWLRRLSLADSPSTRAVSAASRAFSRSLYAARQSRSARAASASVGLLGCGGWGKEGRQGRARGEVGARAFVRRGRGCGATHVGRLDCEQEGQQEVGREVGVAWEVGAGWWRRECRARGASAGARPPPRRTLCVVVRARGQRLALGDALVGDVKDRLARGEGGRARWDSGSE